LSGAGLLVACASLMGPRTVDISREDLLSKLGKQFPTTKRVMRLLDVTAALPALDLDADHNRIAASFELTARELLFDQQYKGKVNVSFGLRYEPSDLTLRLKDVHVDQVQVEGLPPVYQRALTNLGAQLVEDQLQDFPVHHFKPEDLRNADRMGYQVGDIRVTRTGLSIQLLPKS
jgi:hypothetical protein